MTDTGSIDNLPDRARAVPTTVVSDAMDRLGLNGVMDPGLRHMAGGRLTGWATTIDRVPVVDSVNAPNLGMGTQEIIDGSDPGSVVVIAARGDLTSACWGGLMTTRARVRKLSGIVVDGCVRDIEELRELDFPTFARAVSPRMAVGRLTTRAIGEPVTCGGILVHPGDLIVADQDGVVAVPRSAALEVLETAEGIAERESAMEKALRDGMGLVDAVKHFKTR